jgi:hypothetical protein
MSKVIDISNLFSNNNSDKYILQGVFEELSNNQQLCCSTRQCRTWVIPENIHTIKPGQYCIIPTEGGGYFTEWYYYKTLDERNILIFGSFNSTTLETTYTGREIPNVPSNDDN